MGASGDGGQVTSGCRTAAPTSSILPPSFLSFSTWTWLRATPKAWRRRNPPPAAFRRAKTARRRVQVPRGSPSTAFRCR